MTAEQRLDQNCVDTGAPRRWSRQDMGSDQFEALAVRQRVAPILSRLVPDPAEDSDMPVHESRKSRILIDWIAASARRALLGQTPASLREYSFAFDKAAKQIRLKAEVERNLTEDEREALAVAETEIYAERIFDDATEIETMIEIVPLGQPLRPLPDGIAYLRESENPAAMQGVVNNTGIGTARVSLGDNPKN